MPEKMTGDKTVLITAEYGELIAHLIDGRVLKHSDAITLANMLLKEGLTIEDISIPDWRDERGMGVGQRIAI
jgi:hypothetical protein